MHKVDLAWLWIWILACLLGSSSGHGAPITKVVVSNDGKTLFNAEMLLTQFLQKCDLAQL